MEAHSLEPLLVVVGAAMATGILMPRVQILRIPLVVGEILIGILLGKSGFHLIPDDPGPWLELMSLFGFAFLMFLSGLEIDFRSLAVEGSAPEGRGSAAKVEVGSSSAGLRNLLLITGGMFVATLATSLALSFGLVAAGYIQSPWIMALIMVRVINLRSFGWTIDLVTRPGPFLAALALAVGAALLAGLYPAWKMSRTGPAAALREE